MRASFFALLVFFCFSFFPAYAQEGNTEEKKVVEYLSADASEVVPYILSLPGKRFIFIYTTWCPYCREKFPDVAELAALKGDSVIALSVDDDPEKLVRYFQQHDSVPFQPMLVRERYNGEFRDHLADKLGTERGRGIPYMIVLDEQDKVMRAGNFPVAQAAQLILDEGKKAP